MNSYLILITILFYAVFLSGLIFYLYNRYIKDPDKENQRIESIITNSLINMRNIIESQFDQQQLEYILRCAELSILEVIGKL